MSEAEQGQDLTMTLEHEQVDANTYNARVFIFEALVTEHMSALDAQEVACRWKSGSKAVMQYQSLDQLKNLLGQTGGVITWAALRRTDVSSVSFDDLQRRVSKIMGPSKLEQQVAAAIARRQSEAMSEPLPISPTSSMRSGSFSSVSSNATSGFMADPIAALGAWEVRHRKRASLEGR